ncbi:MAG TPA: hypothetical protein VMR21_12635 [Vicinamibacteria bacterium]|nr:hypothetical protein [Vicinamibacteria bacterium]
MAQSKDQLNSRAHEGSQHVSANIDLTRQALDRTIDAIEGKLTPSQILIEGLDLLRSGSTSGATKIFGLARAHPVPVAIIGVGVGMMIREVSAAKGNGQEAPGGYASGYGYGVSGYGAPMGYSTPEAVAHTAHDARDAVASKAQAARSTVSEAAHTAKDAVAEAAHSARETVAEAAHATREKAAAVIETAEERAAGLKERARVQVRDARIGFWQTLDRQPLVVGAAAVAVGLLAGLLAPSTRCEDEMVGEKRDELLARAREKGREVVEKGKHVVGAAVETARTEARQEGLTPGAIKEKVRKVAEGTVETAKSEAQREGLTGARSPADDSSSR